MRKDRFPCWLRITAILSWVLLLIGTTMPANGQTTAELLFDTLASIRKNLDFLPNMDDTVTVATISITEAESDGLGTCLQFNIQSYSDGKMVSYPNPDKSSDLKLLYTRDQGGIIVYPNKLHLNLRFKVLASSRSPDAVVTINLGSRTASNTPNKAEVVFRDVTELNPGLTVGLSGITMYGGVPGRPIRIGYLRIPGLLPLQIDTRKVDLGAFELPFVPISIIYSLPVDQQRLNSAQTSTTMIKGVTSSVSFASESSQTDTVLSSYEHTQETQQKLNETAKYMGYIPNPYIQAIAAGIKKFTSLLGSSDAEQIETNSVTTEHTFNVLYSQTETHTVSVKEGGAGVGDLLIYLLHPRFLWQRKDGKLYLTLISSDGQTFVTAQKLKRGLQRLNGKPAGTLADTLALDAVSIQKLLDLDPFAAGGPTAALAPERFYWVNEPLTYNMSGQSFGQTFSVSRQEIQKFTKARTVTTVEHDKQGSLSAIGLGVDANKQFQSVISQSQYTQTSAGENISNGYTFNGDGQEYYSFKVYLDVVFGTFAFQTIPINNGPTKMMGRIVTKTAAAAAEQKLTLKIGDQSFVTTTDANGHFEFTVPAANNVPKLTFSWGNHTQTVPNSEKGLKRIVLKEGMN